MKKMVSMRDIFSIATRPKYHKIGNTYVLGDHENSC